MIESPSFTGHGCAISQAVPIWPISSPARPWEARRLASSSSP
ncbi:MAG: hypothetical protein ACLU0O_02020 [Collinsella sp.]